MKPTKARIELMQAISDGAVDQHYPLTGGAAYTLRDLGPGAHRRYRTVSAAVAYLLREGYVKTPASHLGDFRPRLWSLTRAGEMWLKANGGSTT